ncbi:MAG: hypothetical protein QM811_16610 [Pirellulales bacterium]
MLRTEESFISRENVYQGSYAAVSVHFIHGDNGHAKVMKFPRIPQLGEEIAFDHTMLQVSELVEAGLNFNMWKVTRVLFVCEAGFPLDDSTPEFLHPADVEIWVAPIISK